MKYILKSDKTKEELAGTKVILPSVMMHDGQDISIFNGTVDSEGELEIKDGKLVVKKEA